jgi:hypothetical protein
MKLTQITVSYGVTQSMPEYCNVKPSVTFTATLDDGDDPYEVESQLWDLARHAVHTQVDAALEANDRPAKYSTDQRFQVMRTAHDRYRRPDDPPKLLVILPNELNLKDHRLHHAIYPESRNMRYAHAFRAAIKYIQDEGGDMPLIDCTDGDLSKLWALLPEQAKQESEVPF